MPLQRCSSTVSGVCVHVCGIIRRSLGARRTPLRRSWVNLGQSSTFIRASMLLFCHLIAALASLGVLNISRPCLGRFSRIRASIPVLFTTSAACFLRSCVRSARTKPQRRGVAFLFAPNLTHAAAASNQSIPRDRGYFCGSRSHFSAPTISVLIRGRHVYTTARSQSRHEKSASKRQT
ncbi:hypothetical protein B0H11DRAFT_1955017, partial [Mycena galericulata]